MKTIEAVALLLVVFTLTAMKGCVYAAFDLDEDDAPAAAGAR